MNINELLVLLDYAQSKLTTMAAAELRRQFQEIETLTGKSQATNAKIEAAYEAGWVEAACWGKRDDLIADIGSPAYLNDRMAHLDSIYAQAAGEPDDCANTPYDEGPFTLAAEPVALPLESSQEAADAIGVVMKEYNYPANPANCARVGWRAARLYTSPTPGARAVMRIALEAVKDDQIEAAIAALEKQLNNG